MFDLLQPTIQFGYSDAINEVMEAHPNINLVKFEGFNPDADRLVQYSLEEAKKEKEEEKEEGELVENTVPPQQIPLSIEGSSQVLEAKEAINIE